MKIKFINLGCKVNLNETQELKRACFEEGYQVVEADERADLVIINSCTVTHISDRKTRQKISQAKREGSLVGVMGCYADINGEIEADLLIPNAQKDTALEAIKNILGETGSIGQAYAYDTTRAFLKVQDGCDNFCSYCIIPYARGRARDMDISKIKEDLFRFIKDGFKEIVLTGINLSAYGKEVNKSLGELIEELSPLLGKTRLRLGSLEPHVISEDFLKVCKSLEGFCPQFHLSLQSGSDGVLKRMNRKYSTQEYKDRVDLIREFFPRAAITTDIIVGFPEESDREFQETLSFVKEINFSHVHVFTYSPRQGTAAARKIDLHPELKKKRSQELREVLEQQKFRYLDSFIGRELEVLFEENNSGLSREYIQCYSEDTKENNSLEKLLVRKRVEDRLLV